MELAPWFPRNHRAVDSDFPSRVVRQTCANQSTDIVGEICFPSSLSRTCRKLRHGLSETSHEASKCVAASAEGTGIICYERQGGKLRAANAGCLDVSGHLASTNRCLLIQARHARRFGARLALRTIADCCHREGSDWFCTCVALAWRLSHPDFASDGCSFQIALSPEGPGTRRSSSESPKNDEFDNSAAFREVFVVSQMRRPSRLRHALHAGTPECKGKQDKFAQNQGSTPVFPANWGGALDFGARATSSREPDF